MAFLGNFLPDFRTFFLTFGRTAWTGIGPSQSFTQDSTAQKNSDRFRASSGIQTHDFGDRAATVIDKQ
jgi:hypothetical protein